MTVQSESSNRVALGVRRRTASCLALLCMAVLSAFLFPSNAAANDVYVSQNGNGGGTSCGDTLSAAWFNTASHWGGNPIGPGTTVHLCGTFTGTAGGTMLFFQGSGTSSNPITLFFEAGANFTAPYWLNGGSGTGGAINTNQQSYIVINGGPTCGWNQATLTVTPCNGAIVNTANGTNLANQATTIAIDVYNSSHITIENIDMHNLYVRTGNAAEDPNWNGQACIDMQGTTTYITMQNFICHDVGWGIIGGTDYITVGPGMEAYNADHNIATAPVHGFIFGNHMHDWAIWDSTSDAYHHDGLHCFGPDTVGLSQQLYLYNNQFDGQTGNDITQFIFLEGNGSSTRCMVGGGTDYIFNNVGVATSGFEGFWGPFGNATTGDMNDIMVNNTAVGYSGSNGVLQVVQNSTHQTVENNVSQGAGELIQQGGSGSTSYAAFDYNAYSYCGSTNCWAAAGVDSGSFAAWQAGTCLGAANTCDPHGIGYPYPMSAPNPLLLDSACVAGSVGSSCAPQSGSPLIGKGANLTSLCTGNLAALCSDIAGNPRPSTGPWTIGAYQSGGTAVSSGATPAAPTNLSVTVE
jgi:hypothetical protein